MCSYDGYIEIGKRSREISFYIFELVKKCVKINKLYSF